MRIRKSPLHPLAVAAFAIATAFLSLTAFAAPAAANAKYAAIVIDANTGKTLYARSADAQRYPASLTKMMTLYVLFEELDAGRIELTTKFSVSAVAARQAPSKLGLRAGSSIKAEDAILALVTKSANDAAVVVAENVSGSVSKFAARMNRTARALGMNNTTFRNPNGLPDPGQHTTARDMARLGLALQDRFPTYYTYFGKRSFTYKGSRLRNHNRLLGSVEGVDGIKTGYIRASGFNIVTNVNRKGRHIIAVVMGGKTASRRDAQMRQLIADYLPKAKRGTRSAPILIADTGADTGADAEADTEVATDADTAAEAAATLAGDVRLPRSRPGDEPTITGALAYAADEGPRDVVAAAMAEAEAVDTEGDVDAEAIETVEDDPIAARIQIASSVAEFADITIQADEGPDPIARLTQLARLRAGVDDIIAGAPTSSDSASTDDPAGWHIQIGAVPTAEGAQALIDRAKTSMGPVLESVHPVTQQVERRGETLYRARFAGFSDKEEARTACQKLKSKSFSCLAVPN